MKKLISIQNLSDLLGQLQKEPTPIFISLSSRDGIDTYLMDRIISKLRSGSDEFLGYQKLNSTISQVIKNELMIFENPVLLLLHLGKIKAIFSGIVAQHQLETALKNLNSQHI